MGEAFAIYRRLVGASMRSQLEYRTSFVLQIAGAFLATFIDFVAVAVIFLHVPALGGWSIHEVAFFYGVSGIAFALTDLVIGHIERIHEQIRDGRFDSVLIRPLPALLQIAGQELSLRRIGRIAQAVAVLIYALLGLEIAWTAGRLLVTASMVLCGTAIFGSIFVIGSAVTFWTLNTSEITNAFTYGGNYMTSWPLNIFGTWLRRILAFGIPLGFINYFPSLYVLGKPDPLGMPGVFRFLGPPVAIAFGAVAALTWRFAVRHYRSTGS